MRTNFQSVINGDEELLGLAKLAGARTTPTEAGSTLLDLRRQRDWASVESDAIGKGLRGLKRRYQQVVLDFSDGAGFLIEASQHWRLLRRPLLRLDA